jgi:hypothetical protein
MGIWSVPRGTVRLYGFLFIESWNFHVNTAGSAKDELLLTSLKREGRRAKDLVIVQHNVNVCFSLNDPIDFQDSAPTPQECWRLCSDRPMIQLRHCNGCSFAVEGTRELQPLNDFHELKLWNKVAHSLCIGWLKSDFSAMSARRNRSKAPCFPVLPPASSVARHIKVKDDSIDVTHRNLILNCQPQSEYNGGAVSKTFHPEVKIQSVIASSYLRSSKDSSEAVNECTQLARLLNPGAIHDSLDADSLKAQLPKKDISRQRPRFDIAGMHVSREMYAMFGPFIRFLAFDCSPQCREAWEVMNTSELIVRRDAIIGKVFEDIDPNCILRRKLPLACIGQGAADVIGRCWTVLHQNWLDYGGTHRILKAALDDCYGCFTDMGVEMQVNDTYDVTQEFVYRLQNPNADINGEEDYTPTEFLFKNSIGVVGPLHCIDWIIRTAMGKLEFFPLFLKHCKHILQFLHGRRHRVWILAIAKKLGLAQDSLDLISEALKNSTDRFAKWRWRSLWQCLKDLERNEPVLKEVIGRCNLATWTVKVSSDVAKSLSFSSHPSNDLWKCREVAELITAPLMRLHGWFQGCHCHTPEDRARAGFHCPFQGMRAKWAAKRVSECIEVYRNLQNTIGLEQCFEGEPPVVAVSAVQNVLGFIAAMLNLKLLSWMRDIPFSIWEVGTV